MSLPFVGFKAAQLGLVDMGNISFYSGINAYLPTPQPLPTPVFNIADLYGSYAGIFNEIVLNVTWRELQASEGGPLDTSFIDSAIAQVNSYNATYGTDLGIKMRVWGGYQAPEWAIIMNGPPVTVTGQGSVDPNQYGTQAIGRVWTADYNLAWANLQATLAASYDGNRVIRGISQSTGGSASDEPFVPLKNNAPLTSAANSPTVNQPGQLELGGYSDAAEMLTLRAAISSYAQWSTTPLDYTFNNFHLFDSGSELPFGNFTLAVMQQARNSSRMVQAGNHALRDPLYSPDEMVYGQLAGDATLKPGSVPNSFQTAAPIILAGYAGWQGAVTAGVALNAGNIELWDFPTAAGQPNGFLSFSPSQLQGLAAILAAGSPPPVAGAPDDGSALGFVAPAFVTAAPGRVAFAGTDAVLLASGASPGLFNVTLTSLNGGTLGIGGLGPFFGPTSGTTLSFQGSLSTVNTVLAHLTDTVSSGTDVVRIVATDSSGNIATRDVGVLTAPAIAPPTGTPGLLVAEQSFAFTGGSALVVGQGTAGNFNVATQLGNSGILVVGGVQSGFALGGNLTVDNSTSLLAALSPNAYSTASLSIGGAFAVETGASTYFSGLLSAATIANNGGTIRGNGTLNATGATSIANTGTIEAVADMTLGSQRLVVSDNLTGTGRLVVDAGATLVLSGTVASTQAVTFAVNTGTQLANLPYSPSTLVLAQPASFDTGTINGFTFADRLVLQNFSVSGTPTYSGGAGGVLTLNAGTPSQLTLSMPDPDGNLTGLAVKVTPVGTGVMISFAPTSAIAPDVIVPASLHGTNNVQVLVPNVVLKVPLAESQSIDTETYKVTIEATGATPGIIRIPGFGSGTQVVIDNVPSSATSGLHTTLAQIQLYLQTLTYEARGTADDTITITVVDSQSRSSGAIPISVVNAAAGTFGWTGAGTTADFGDPQNWGLAITAPPPGGGNVAEFAGGDHVATGNGAVGVIYNFGTTTLTGNVTAQGRGELAVSVDAAGGGAALILTGGAMLTAQQQVLVGNTGRGLLTVSGAALAMTGPATQASLVIGQGSGSTGTVLNLEQITATGTVVVGAAGSGTLELLGVASTVIDAGADIGQTAGSQGSAIVNGGQWINSGLLTIGDAGTGALTINGMTRGITGQVTAFNATIGNQAGGQGTVTLDGGELLVANIFESSSTLVVGNAGTGSLLLDNGSEVQVGAAQGLVANNTGTLFVGAAGNGLVRVGAYSSLLVYGDAVVGNGAGAGEVIVGQGANDSALFAMTGTLAVGSHGEVTLGGTHATLRAANINIAQGGELSGTGTVSGLGGGNNTVSLAAIDNDGSITAEGGNLLLYGTVSGSGALAIGPNSTLILQAEVDSGQTLAFGVNGRAILNDARAFHGTIVNFNTDDLLDIGGIQVSSASYVNGALVLQTATGPIEITMIGPYSATSFSVRPDGLGGTYVTAGGYGDVHIVSLDGFAYDFQAVGEFLAARSTGPGTPWEVQIQTDGHHGTASWTTGLAAAFGDAIVIFQVGKPITLHVDGAPGTGGDTVLSGDAAHILPGGYFQPLSNDTWRVTWNNGETIVVSEHGISLDWDVSAGSHDPASVQGLLGTHSAPWSYAWRPDGTMARQTFSNDQIVGAYADSWRTTGHSLFEHHPIL